MKYNLIFIDILIIILVGIFIVEDYRKWVAKNSVENYQLCYSWQTELNKKDKKLAEKSCLQNSIRKMGFIYRISN